MLRCNQFADVYKGYTASSWRVTFPSSLLEKVPGLLAQVLAHPKRYGHTVVAGIDMVIITMEFDNSVSTTEVADAISQSFPVLRQCMVACAPIFDADSTDSDGDQ